MFSPVFHAFASLAIIAPANASVAIVDQFSGNPPAERILTMIGFGIIAFTSLWSVAGIIAGVFPTLHHWMSRLAPRRGVDLIHGSQQSRSLR